MNNMKKFNIAFTPKSHLEEFISLAETSKDKSHNYCLGENSIPHITVCQFFSSEDSLDKIWEEACSSVPNPTICVNLNRVSNISFDGQLYWVSLLPHRDSELQSIFSIISKIVKPIRIDEYDPHITLFNYFPNKLNVEEVLKTKICIEDEFELVIGECDGAGQLQNILYKNEYQSLTLK